MTKTSKVSIPHRQGTTDLADNYVSEKSSEVLGDDLYEKTCQFLIGKVQHKKFRFKILINNEVEGEIIMQFYGILCQFLIGKVQRAMTLTCVWRIGNMCQFLIGKVQRYTEQFLKLLIDQNVSIPHRQGTTRGRHEMPVSDFIFDEVSIPHRQGTTPENVQTTEATVIVSIPHRQGTTIFQECFILVNHYKI